MTGPLLFQPTWHRRLWGSADWSATGLTPPPTGAGDPFGECWLLSPLPGHESRTADGSSIHALTLHDPEAMLGAAFVRRFGTQFPVLVKLLTTAQILSVQVHPRPHGDILASGKDECWIAVAAKPGAEMSVGLRPGWDAARIAALGGSGDWAPALNAVQPEPGDAVDINGGTVHALGAGLTVLEIQLPCDITYRLSDWGRVGADGKPRALHVRDGTAAIAWPQPALALTRGWISSGKPLTTAGYTVTPSRERTLDGNKSWTVLLPWDGALTLRGSTGAVTVPRLIPALIPAACGPLTVEPAGATVWVVVRGRA